VRWGGGPAGCSSREHVLDWVGAVRKQGVRTQVGETLVRRDAVVLGLTVTDPGGEGRRGRPANVYQVFRLGGDGGATTPRVPKA